MSVQSEPALDFSPQPPSQCPGPSSVHTLTRTQTRLWLCVQAPTTNHQWGRGLQGSGWWWPDGVLALTSPCAPGSRRHSAYESSAERNCET